MSLANGLSILFIFSKNQQRTNKTSQTNKSSQRANKTFVFVDFCYGLFCFFCIYFYPNFYNFFPSTSPFSLKTNYIVIATTLFLPVPCKPPAGKAGLHSLSLLPSIPFVPWATFCPRSSNEVFPSRSLAPTLANLLDTS